MRPSQTHSFVTIIKRKMGTAPEATYACNACGMRSHWEGASDPCPSSLRAIADGTKAASKLLVHRKARHHQTVCGRLIDDRIKTTQGTATVTCRWCISRAAE